MQRYSSVLALSLFSFFPATAIFAQSSSTPESALPKDINPDSRNRLPLIKREDLDDSARKEYDAAVAAFPGARGSMGAEIRLHGTPGIVPQTESPLGLPLMQLAILITAREHDQPFEWPLHEMQALAVGLDPVLIDVVRNRQPVAKLGEREAVIIQLGREIFGTHKLNSESYARAFKLLGEHNLVDVVSVMADYSRTSALLSAFNQQMPPGWKQALPLPFTLPDDIHPDSRSRVALIKGPSPAPAPGTFQTSLWGRELSPKGTGPTHLRRHGGGLDTLETRAGRPAIDLAILITAREHDAQYDWTINELAALQGGLDPAIIDVVRNRKSVEGLAEKDATLIELGRELFGKHYVSARTYTRAVNAIGERDLMDLVEVMGHHSREAVLLTAFDQHLPAGQKALLPIP